ncbi:MAG TPA: hypothetical protein VFT22_08270 [Kofleriaceae bacterium]|nr:hypothetical protein [Kofleriaceae bacterium]
MRLVLALVVALCACKGDPVKCDQGCRNFATLVYWKRADAEIAAAPAAQRDALRKRMLGKFDNDLEAGIDQCVTQCQSANNTAVLDCMIAAKTADQAIACTK